MASWLLDPSVAHLNHGSFGATPVEVLHVQAELRAEMESNPVDFMLRRYQPLLEIARNALAEFVGADSDGLVFVPNATYGVNSVLRSLESQLPPGSDIVVTTHTYNACRNAAAVTAERIGGSLVVAEIPFPITDPAEATSAILNVVSAKTALVVLDHVTSATGLVLPIKEITAALEPNVLVLIDGAHAPGMIDVDVQGLGASFYTANCHKWICAPKGAAFLYAADRHRPTTRAVAVSHGYNDGWPASDSSFHAQFDWTGTDDPTARLSVPAALSTMQAHHERGWAGIRADNHELALAGRKIIADALEVDLPAPDSMIGSIASLPVPSLGAATEGAVDALSERLAHAWAIEVPVSSSSACAHRLLRISAQQYNTLADYDHLATALRTELNPLG